MNGLLYVSGEGIRFCVFLSLVMGVTVSQCWWLVLVLLAAD